MKALCAPLTLTFLLTGCLTTPASVGVTPVTQDLGALEFPNSGSKEAQESFMAGILLLHSFRQRRRDSIGVDRGILKPFWFQENLVPLALGKSHHLVFQ